MDGSGVEAGHGTRAEAVPEDLLRPDLCHTDSAIPQRNLISQLPAELIGEVIRLCLPEHEPVAKKGEKELCLYMVSLFSLRGVSQRWRSIVDGTPRLWPFLASILPLDVNEAIILRSRECPISVLCSSQQSANPPATWPGNFLDVVKRTQYRWSSYSGYLPPSSLKAPMPLLHTIDVWYQGHSHSSNDEDPTRAIDLLGGATSNIRHVSLDSTSIKWKMGMFANLVCFELYDIMGDGLTSTQLLDILLSSPQMEVFELDGIVATVYEPSPPQLIPLLHLKTFRMAGCDARLVDLILGSVQAPLCTQFHAGIIANDPTFNITTFLNERLRPFRNLFLQSHRSFPANSEIFITSTAFDWSGGRDKLQFGVVVEGPMNPVDLSFVTQTFENERGVSLVMSGVSDTLWAKVAPLHCVTKLSAGTSDHGGIITRLAQPLTPDSLLPPLPSLQTLPLYYIGWTNQELLDALQARYETLAWNGVGDYGLTIELPRNPRRLHGAYSWKDVTLSERKELRGSKWVKGVELWGPKDVVGILGYLWDDGPQSPIWGGHR